MLQMDLFCASFSLWADGMVAADDARTWPLVMAAWDDLLEWHNIRRIESAPHVQLSTQYDLAQDATCIDVIVSQPAYRKKLRQTATELHDLPCSIQ